MDNRHHKHYLDGIHERCAASFFNQCLSGAKEFDLLGNISETCSNVSKQSVGADYERANESANT